MATADTVFSASTNTFPGWNNPDPSSYAWTLPNTSHWYNFGQTLSQGVFSFVANTLLELIAWVLHIAIYVSSYFSDPKGITDPVVQAAAGVFRGAYQTVFMKLLPVLVMMFVAYIAWKYVVAHHAKILSGIISTLAATALIGLFFFDFGQTFNTIDSFGQLVTNTAASAVASAAGTNVGSEYDTLWQNYVLFPWEYGQFGQFSGTLSDFNVSSGVCQDANVNCSWTNDAGQRETTISGNWVTLFLKNTSSSARTSLENALTQAAKDGVNPFTGSSLSAQAVTNANPYAMIPFLVIELLLLIVPVIFLVYVGFQLFVRELLFIVTIMMGMVTVPMAFVPEIGWRVTANWIREAVGHQVERLGNAVYAALLFLVASLITQSVAHSEFGMMSAFLVDAILFAAALIYRQKVFSIAVNPLSDSVRGVDQHQRMTMDEYVAQQHEREQREGRYGSHEAAGGHKLGKLAEHFATTELHHDEHHVTAASGRHLDDTLHIRPENEQKPVSLSSEHLASHFKDEAETQPKRPNKIVRHLGSIGQAAKQRVEQHLQDTMNPGRPKSHEERIREREQRARGLEGKLHKHSVKALHRSVSALVSRPQLSDVATNPPDDSPPAPPGAPPADAGIGYDKQRKTMVTPDGYKTQNVITDKNGREIAVEPPSIARPRRDEAGIDVPTLAEGFNVPAQDSPANSATEQSSQPISVAQQERVTEAEQPGQVTLATEFTVEPQPEPIIPEPGLGLSPEKPASDMAENGTSLEGILEASGAKNNTLVQPAHEPVPQSNSGADTPVSTGPIPPVQPRPLPSNVTRLEDERGHRSEVEGRQREQRTQRRARQTQGRRVVRVNERSPRPPRPRGPEL